jgi:hypothetical protein
MLYIYREVLLKRFINTLARCTIILEYDRGHSTKVKIVLNDSNCITQ